MSDTYDALSDYVDSVVKSAIKTDKKTAEAIKKWKYLLVSTTMRVSSILHSSEEDVLADLLVSIVRMGATYDSIQYRYRGGVYDLVDCDCNNVRLKTPEFSKLKNMKDFIISNEKVELIRKASLSSLVYHNIQQSSQLMLRNHFTQKNGYKVTGTNSELVKTRGNTYEATYKTHDVKRVSRITEVSLSSPGSIASDNLLCLEDLIPSDDYNQEDYLQASILDKNIRSGLSKEANMVYICLQNNPQLSEVTLKQQTGLTIRQVKFSKREILLQLDKVLDKKIMSVYSPYAVYDGEYYYLGEDNGEIDDGYVFLKPLTPKRVNGFYVDKQKVGIDSLKYRTPVHLRTSLV